MQLKQYPLPVTKGIAEKNHGVSIPDNVTLLCTFCCSCKYCATLSILTPPCSCYKKIRESSLKLCFPRQVRNTKSIDINMFKFNFYLLMFLLF